MTSFIAKAAAWAHRRVENVIAALLGIMFVAFVLQIVFRYFLNLPTGWSTELSVIAWLYIVLLGSALWLKDDEEIRLDLLSAAVGPRARRVINFIAATAAVVLFGMALPATVKYVAFMKVESSSYLNIRMDILYAVYVVFAVAVILRYAWSAWTALRGEADAAEGAARTGGGA